MLVTEEEQHGAGRDEHGDRMQDAEVGGLGGAELGGELLHGGPEGDLKRALGRRRPKAFLQGRGRKGKRWRSAWN